MYFQCKRCSYGPLKLREVFRTWLRIHEVIASHDYGYDFCAEEVFLEIQEFGNLWTVALRLLLLGNVEMKTKVVYIKTR